MQESHYMQLITEARGFLPAWKGERHIENSVFPEDVTEIFGWNNYKQQKPVLN